MRSSFIFAGGAIALAAAGIISTASFAPLAAQSITSSPRVQAATFAIANLTCALCPVTVRKAIQGLSGVKSVAVNFNAKTATVLFDPSKASLAAIANASTRAGYPAHPVKG